MQKHLAIACAMLVWAAPCLADTGTESRVLQPAADTTVSAESARSIDEAAPDSGAARPIGAGFGTSDLLPEDSEVPDGFGLMARTALSLGVVLLVIWGALVLMRRTTGGGSGSRTSHIRVLDRTYLAPKRAVYVVQVGQRTLALGVTDTNISQLADLAEGEFPEVEERSGAIPFANVLDGARRRFSRQTSPDDTYPTGASS